jgi:hypothetical protein
MAISLVALFGIATSSALGLVLRCVYRVTVLAFATSGAAYKCSDTEEGTPVAAENPPESKE